MLHNLAHIELNAIDLAWDTVVRFSPLRLPPAFYEDFARVGGCRHACGWGCGVAAGLVAGGWGQSRALVALPRPSSSAGSGGRGCIQRRAAAHWSPAQVADDEARHLGWCLQRLQELGADYGDMVAHDLLWEGCAMSAGGWAGGWVGVGGC
jgi:hypothetical protein